MKKEFKIVSKRAKVLLQSQESNIVDFKRYLNGLNQDDIVAFANSKNGGAILIGVDENKNKRDIQKPKICGCTIGDTAKVSIHNQANNCFPPIKVEVFVENMSIKPFFRIEIPSGPEKPYSTQGGRYTIREDGNKRPMQPSEVLSMFLEKESRLFYERFSEVTKRFTNEFETIREDLDSELDGLKYDIETKFDDITDTVRDETAETTESISSSTSELLYEISTEVSSTISDVSDKLNAIYDRIEFEVIPDLKQDFENKVDRSNYEVREEVAYIIENLNQVIHELIENQQELNHKINSLESDLTVRLDDIAFNLPQE